MVLEQVVSGLKDGSITILNNNHLTNSLVDELERKLIHNQDMIKKYSDLVSAGDFEENKVKPSSMLSFYKAEKKIEFGKCLFQVEHYCFNCDARMYVFLFDEKTIGYIDSNIYWKIADESGKKYEFIATKEHCPECAASHLVKKQKLTSEIEFPTGEVVFTNYFQTEILYKDIENKYASINSILGRDKLMQVLAKQNVGYGQMGNMSVHIYSNENDEIIVGNNLDYYEGNKYYYDNNPEKIDDDWVKTVEITEKFKKELEDGNFKNMGRISLSVWRWQCADKQILEYHKDKTVKEAKKNYMDIVNCKVQPGRWKVEHFYDFQTPESEIIYSRLKLIK